MSLDKIIDEKIRAAMARGEFDNLPGQGRPQDHNTYFDLPEDVRMGYTLLKNAGYIPQEAQLLKDIAALQDRLNALTDEGERRRLSRALRDKRLEFDILLERRNRRAHPPRSTTR